MSAQSSYPIGTPGQAWGHDERIAWRERISRKRSYAEEVLGKIDTLRDRFVVEEYGALDHNPKRFPLFAIRSRAHKPDAPNILVTGGVHGYETSGVQGALAFLEQHAEAWLDRVNLVVVPCVSPWAYETVQRWNRDAVDPNRSFIADSPAQESGQLMAYIKKLSLEFAAHVDLHETTDTDESEFRPALAARDGKGFKPGEIPDGFYLVDDSRNRQLGFQQALIAAVEQHTHIAEPDAEGQIIGSPLIARGVIEYPLAELGLCASMTGARYTTTTEVYPDSPRTSPEQCNRAQVAAIEASIEFVLRHPGGN